MVTIGVPAETTSPWRAARTFILPDIRRGHLRVFQFDLRLIQQRLCVLHLAVRCGYGFGLCLRLGCVGLCHLERGSGGSHVLFGGIDRCFCRVERGHLFVS